MANAARGQNIFTPEFRGSFVHLFDFEPDQQTGQPTNKHSINMLFPKRSADWRADLPELYANLCEALQLKYPGWVGLPPIFNDHMSKAWPVADGDLPNSRGNTFEGNAGHWVVRAASINFNTNLNLIRLNAQGQSEPVPQGECFSGCFFEAQINSYFYDKNGGLGVGFGLNNVKWTRTGESLGGGGENAAAAWGAAPAVATGAAAFTPGQPPAAAGAPPAGFPPAAGTGAAPAAGPGVPPVGAPPPNFLT